MSLDVRPVDATTHRDFVEERSGSFLQLPSWAGVKPGWRSLRLGWYDGSRLVGTGLVLLRDAPVVRRCLAYVPEGPVIDWTAYDAAEVTTPLLQHLKTAKAFSVKIGPQLRTRTWSAESLKDAIAAGAARRIAAVPPDTVDQSALATIEELRAQGWSRAEADDEGSGFGDLQPRYVFQVPLAGRSLDDVFGAFNQMFRRNVRKAEKSGVVVDQGGYDDLPAFHEAYVVTAGRDGFKPRPLSYFQQMWRAMNVDDGRLRLYLARHEGDLLAAATCVRVGGHVWYSYGASVDHKRELRPSNAIQWRMLSDAHASGADVYDLRGISDTLVEDDPLFGLIRFKLGTGGEAVEYAGEWDYPLSKALSKAFQIYLSRR